MYKVAFPTLYAYANALFIRSIVYLVRLLSVFGSCVGCCGFSDTGVTIT